MTYRQDKIKRLNKHRLTYQWWRAHLFGITVENSLPGEWMTVNELLAVEARAFKACYGTAIPEEETAYGPFQCGLCRWFAAVGGDWGLCGCKDSPHDCRMVFEHGGCREHSAYVQLVKEGEIEVRP